MDISRKASAGPKKLTAKNNKQDTSNTTDLQENTANDLFAIERLIADPKKITPNNILFLQRNIGNQAVMRLLHKNSPTQIQRHGSHSHPHSEEEETALSSQVNRLIARDSVEKESTTQYNSAISALPAPAEQAPTNATTGQPVQRLWDRNDLLNKAGVPATGASKYNSIYKKLDAYHSKAQKVWSRGKNAITFKKELNKVLDNLAKAVWVYVKSYDTSPQVPFLRELANTEIPSERKLVDKLGNKDDFSTQDRTKSVGEVKDGQPAQLLSSGIQVGETSVTDTDENGVAQGHQMDVWAEIDAGREPIKPEKTPPNSVYGVNIQYWENVEIPYNFIAGPNDNPAQMKNQGVGAITKPWNDIMAMRPDGATFGKAEGPVELSWQAATTGAENRTLRGVKKIGFTDKPGVTPKNGKYIKRILRFRVVIKDSFRQQEIFATQVFKTDGGDQPVYKTYVDSKGNKLGAERDANDPTTLNQMGINDPKIQNHDVTNQVLAQSVPATARAQVQNFVTQLVKPNSNPAPTPFNYQELTQLQQAFPNAPLKGMGSPYVKFSTLANLKNNAPNDDSDNYYIIQGMNLLPVPDTGQAYKEFVVPAGGLLVAVMGGQNIERMYFTDNQARALTGRNINVRTYAEIPIEEVMPYVEKQKYLDSLSVNEKNAFNTATQAKTQETTAKGQLVNNGITPALVSDNTATTYLVQHPEQYDLIEQEYNSAKTPAKFETAVLNYFQGEVNANGATANEYARLHAQVPNLKAWKLLREAMAAKILAGGQAGNIYMARNQVDTLYTTNRATFGTSGALTPLVNNNQNNKANLETAIMNFIRTNKGKIPSIENDYNTLVPTLNLPGVYQTLGELVNSFFINWFTLHGKEVDIFAQAMADYPDFQYRLIPAYRKLFGEAQLKNVMQQMRKAHAYSDMPDPGSQANMEGKRAFRNHPVFAQQNFTTSLNDAAKFDATYNPATNQLKLTVKLKFDFQDSTKAPAPVKGKEVGSEYGKTAWSNQTKQNYIADFKKNTLDIWNKSATTIKCTRPGWEDIMAVPVFDIQSVTDGSEHNAVRVHKSTLFNETPKKKSLKGVNSGWASGGSNFNETDVANKISDPTVHKYLHQGERIGSVQAAYNTDQKALETRLGEYGRLDFVAGSSDTLVDPQRLQILAQELNRMGLPSDLAKLHPLVLEASVSGKANKKLSNKRGATVETSLKQLGITNPVKITVGPNNYNGVVVKAGAPDPKITDTYITKWSRITAAHEFGHMLGLMDEYYGAKSDAVVKKLISDGMLPPDTRGDHLVAKPAGAGQDEAPGQEATMKLLEANDLTTPNFTLTDKAMSTSIMTGGYEVWSQHFISAWEALTKLTEGSVESKYWKIS